MSGLADVLQEMGSAPTRWTGEVVELVDASHVKVAIGSKVRTCYLPSDYRWLGVGQSVVVVYDGNLALIEGITGAIPIFGVPTGFVGIWFYTTPPAGWLILDGSTFSAETYPALAAHLGSTTLPNLKGKFVLGLDSAASAWDTIGETGGKAKSDPTSIQNGTGTSDTVQDAGTNDNMPPYITAHFIMRT